ncbi:MAG: M1 family metallopeptidase, partial [Thermoanaerobaculia bacterium]|nr:M1 family metallopeptidase [Thermoanaerobaculia bacterium]
DIVVSLDPGKKTVDGRETLRWTNSSDVPVSELRFHLYWNAFRNNRSTLFRESGGRLRDDFPDKDAGWGSIDVTAMSWEGVDLSRGFRFDSPDDGNPDDRTVLVVPLPRPVQGGETIALSIRWKAKVPKIFARAGYVRDFFFLGQWFPKLGVFEAKGRRRRAEAGWNCHQYHASSEFYADFGDYRVAITVPERFVVAAAGALVNETRANGKKTVTYEQKSIHDFAFTADPRYVVKEGVFDPEKDLTDAEVTRASKLLGRTPEALRAGFRKVALRFYMQPDHVGQWTRHQDAQKWGLAWLGLHAFPYPYAQVSIVDTPEDGTGATGMEYQTLFTTYTSKLLGRWPFSRVRVSESTTIHELAHGYWYGLLASNEFEESWMDEGIASFTEAEMVDRRYGLSTDLPPGIGYTEEDSQRAQAALSPDFDRIVTPSWKFRSGGSYGRNSYPQPATAIQQVRRLLGEETFWRAFRGYAERWRYDYPTSEDFFDAMRAPGIPAVAEVIRKVWLGTSFIDVSVLEARTEKAEKFKGFDDAGKPFGFEETPKGPKKIEDKGVKKAKKDGKDGPWESVVVVGRDGDLVLPAEVVLTFADGTAWRKSWDGADSWIRFHVTSQAALVKAEADPGRRIVLDRNPWNNAKFTKRYEGPSAAAKGRTYALHLVQILLSSLWAVL